MPRKSTGKRLRFEVFKRDGFACVYCGAQPPDVVLVADHIDPVASGGASTIDNLNTACETCNQGKAHKSLGLRAVRPDADLLYLEAQQEIAELRRYQASLEGRDAALSAVIARLQKLWVAIAGTDWHPAEHVLRQMINRYDLETIEAAIRDVAPKVGTGYITQSGWVPYMWAVAKNMVLEDKPVEPVWTDEELDTLNWTGVEYFADKRWFIDAHLLAEKTIPRFNALGMTDRDWSVAMMNREWAIHVEAVSAMCAEIVFTTLDLGRDA